MGGSFEYGIGPGPTRVSEADISIEKELPMAKKRKKSGSSRANLSKISTAALQSELERREGELEELETYRAELVAELSEVDRELKDLGAVVSSVSRTKRAPRTYGGGGGKRPHNKWNLEESLARVLRHKTMGVSEVADAVQKAGYKTTSPNFRTIVNQTLLKSKLIKKLGRSAYTAA